MQGKPTSERPEHDMSEKNTAQETQVPHELSFTLQNFECSRGKSCHFNCEKCSFHDLCMDTVRDYVSLN